jgi:hypothetical protein
VAQPFETHYDILRVMRNAPVGVIKTSYRVMSQKYHPDRNPAPDAVDLMTRINQAWDVLRDPERRATHDRWIATQEARTAAPGPAPAPAKVPVMRVPVWLKRYGIGLVAAIPVVAAVCLLVVHYTKPAPMDFDDPALTEQAGSDTGEKTVWLAKPWEAVPATRLPHGYIDGEEQYYSDGLSSIEFDNTVAAVDAEVRLYRNGRTVRSMFVHKGARFVAEKLPEGTYSMKFKVAVDGKMRAYQANDVYQLSQGAGDDTAARTTIQLSKVAGGTHDIPLDQI